MKDDLQPACNATLSLRQEITSKAASQGLLLSSCCTPSQYQLYLPSKELLKQKLDEWSALATR